MKITFEINDPALLLETLTKCGRQFNLPPAGSQWRAKYKQRMEMLTTMAEEVTKQSHVRLVDQDELWEANA